MVEEVGIRRHGEVDLVGIEVEEGIEVGILVGDLEMGGVIPIVLDQGLEVHIGIQGEKEAEGGVL